MYVKIILRVTKTVQLSLGLYIVVGITKTKAATSLMRLRPEEMYAVYNLQCFSSPTLREVSLVSGSTRKCSGQKSGRSRLELMLLSLIGALLESASEMVSNACSAGDLLESASEMISHLCSLGDLLESAKETLSLPDLWCGSDHFAESLTLNCLRMWNMFDKE
jgi:hypothetical protein